MCLQAKPALGPTGGPTVQIKFERAITPNRKDTYKMDMVMNTPRGSMKIQTEGRRIANAFEKK